MATCCGNEISNQDSKTSAVCLYLCQNSFASLCRCCEWMMVFLNLPPCHPRFRSSRQKWEVAEAAFDLMRLVFEETDFSRLHDAHLPAPPGFMVMQDVLGRLEICYFSNQNSWIVQSPFPISEWDANMVWNDVRVFVARIVGFIWQYFTLDRGDGSATWKLPFWTEGLAT